MNNNNIDQMACPQRSSDLPSARAVKPIRPLAAYHLFFQLEREYLIQNIKPSVDEPTTDHVDDDDRPLGIDIDPQMPARYKNITLSPAWCVYNTIAHKIVPTYCNLLTGIECSVPRYKSASGKRIKTKESERKRAHRRVHGKISFQELSNHVATRWKTLEFTDLETKMYCAKIAKREFDLYKQKMKQYKENTTLASDNQGHDACSNLTKSSKLSIAYDQTSILSAPGNANVTASKRKGTSMNLPVKMTKPNDGNERVLTGEVSLATLNSGHSRISNAVSDLISLQNNQRGALPPSYLHNTVQMPSQSLSISSVPCDNNFNHLLAMRQELDANLESLLFIRRELAACNEIATMEYFHLRNLRGG